MKNLLTIFALFSVALLLSCGSNSSSGHRAEDFGLSNGDVLTSSEVTELLSLGFVPEGIIMNHPYGSEVASSMINRAASIDDVGGYPPGFSGFCWFCTQWTIVVIVHDDGSTTQSMECTNGVWHQCGQLPNSV